MPLAHNLYPNQADCRAHLGCCIWRLPPPSLPPPRLHADVRRRSFGPAWGRTGVGLSLPSGSHRGTVATEPAWGRSRFVGTVASLDPRSRPTKGRDPRSPTADQASQATSAYPGKHGGARPALLPTVTTTAAATSPSPPLSPRRSQLSPAQRPHRPVSSPRSATPRHSPPPRRLPPSRANGELSPWRTLRPDTVNPHLWCAGPTLPRSYRLWSLEPNPGPIALTLTPTHAQSQHTHPKPRVGIPNS